jgi:hypothetical protein
MNKKILISALLGSSLLIYSCNSKEVKTGDQTLNETGSAAVADSTSVSKTNIASASDQKLVGKTFERQLAPGEKPNKDPELSNPGFIEFKTDSTADYLPGGDIIFPATYQVSGNKISLKSDMGDEKKELTIVDENTLKDSKGNTYKAK